MLTCSLEAMAHYHPIDTSIFLPCVIARLGVAPPHYHADFSVVLRDIGITGERKETLRLLWNPANVPLAPLGVQEHIITEWAACGVASALVASWGGLHISAVASEGDRFDYWVSQDTEEFGLEVSGTQSERPEDLEARYRQKRRQLLDNPFGVAGYVIVVGFVLRQVIFGFHPFQEGER